MPSLKSAFTLFGCNKADSDTDRGQRGSGCWSQHPASTVKTNNGANKYIAALIAA